ncbi:hypothetical protein LA080_001779 [Diaporthe eres]|nr:hypothetical protein LA080_001779 [Diaporthe eres]
MFADSVASITTFSQEARTEYILRSVEELKNMSQRSLVNHDDLRVQIYEITKGPKGLHYMIDALKALDDARARGNDDTHVAELLSQLKADMDNTRDNIDKRQEDLKEIRAQLERTFTQQMPLEFNQSDGFVYNISILSREDGVHDAASSTHCRATLDTGCHDNWVSTGIIERADLQGSIIAITDSDQFKSFSGHVMEPQGQIELTFFLATVSASSQQTRTETFYVFDQLPVDLVLGKGFIAKQFTLVSKHALGLVRQGKFTQEEVRTIEISLKEQGAANAEISSLRRAADSSAREARRAQKAASRATTRGSNTPFSGASGWGTPRHPDSILRVDTRSSSLMVPTSRLHISSTQASEASGPEDDGEPALATQPIEARTVYTYGELEVSRLFSAIAGVCHEGGCETGG